MRIRVGSTSEVVHEVRSAGETVCGVLYTPLEDLKTLKIVMHCARFMGAVLADEPVDCMTCLVRDQPRYIDGKMTMHFTIRLMSIPVLEPEK